MFPQAHCLRRQKEDEENDDEEEENDDDQHEDAREPKAELLGPKQQALQRTDSIHRQDHPAARMGSSPASAPS